MARMNKKMILTAMSAVGTASSVMAATMVYCRWCGSSASSVQSQTGNKRSKSPAWRHEGWHEPK